ncbi:hypothetical protein [Zoogloea sp.]|uniref:hypothetical protein n=1 Tax=Zoogloea sp. TaxID=49181 RepID=UPI00263382A1|nr:hypothetical protein [uncultured Zoogloea sp.]
MKLNALVLAAAALLAAPAFAHDDATLDAMTAPHGGQLRMSGAYHLELVLAKDARGDAPAPVRVYLSDHGGKPVPVAGASASALLLSPAGKQSVVLAAAGDRLEGKARYAADPGMKVVVTLKLADGQSETARFEPFRPR